MSEAKASGLGAAWRIMHALVLSVAAIALGLMLLAAPVRARAATDANAVNRFNVVLVVDASGSMALTDPEGYRFEAVSQFSGLLAEQGNYIGSVVFTEEIPAKVDVAPANSQADKDAILSSIASVPAGGDTNIGAALQTAVNMIKSGGNPDLPSVIVFLSDGNTDLATSEAMDESLEMKGEALQAAREGGIAVYSVCLNVDGGADISEMQQISNATGGQFAEVKTAADLQDVFNTFYALIYGTSTIQLVDEVFPSDGVLETPFDVPAGGVEEVNIVIYGSVTSTELVAPNGTSGTPDMLSGNTFSIIKLTDILPGTWTLKTTGAPGDRIRINMVYNSSLGVQASLDPESGDRKSVV